MQNNSLTLSEQTADRLFRNSSDSECASEIEFKMLPLSRVFPNPEQPRKFFDKSTLEELAQSIKENGVLQPILVRSFGDKYQIVSGERRYQASLLAGAKSIPAVIRRLDEEKTMLAALIENIQRQELNPIEEARAMRTIILNYGLTHSELALKTGRSRSALTNKLRLLQLPEDVQKLIANGRLSSGHAKMLAGMKDSLEIKAWVKRIVKEQLSVYELEKQIAQKRCSGNEDSAVKAKKSQDMTKDMHTRAVEENLQELLGAKVRIRQGKTRGRIEIEFYDQEDLERVIDSMVSQCL